MSDRPISRLLTTLAAVTGRAPRRNGRQFAALCPSHGDRDASLSIAEGDDGRVLLKCFAGCDVRAIVRALGLRMTDLFAGHGRRRAAGDARKSESRPTERSAPQVPRAANSNGNGDGGTEPNVFELIATACAAQTTDGDLAAVGKMLGVTPASLRELGVAVRVRNSRDAPIGICWVERDAHGCAVGLVTRDFEIGKQKAESGSKRGILPVDYDAARGPTLIVEGMSDTASACTMNLNVIGRASCTSSSAMLGELIGTRIALGGDEAGEVIVIAERDEKEDGKWPGRTGAISLAQSLADDLKRPIRWAFVPEPHKDTRGFLNAHADESSGDLGKRLVEHLEATATEVCPRKRRRSTKAGKGADGGGASDGGTAEKGNEPATGETPTDPFSLASEFLQENPFISKAVGFSLGDKGRARALRTWRDTVYVWDGRRYCEVYASDFSRRAALFLNGHLKAVTKPITGNVVEAAQSLCLVPAHIAPPVWLGEEACEGPSDPQMTITCQNGVLDLVRLFSGEPLERVLRKHDPRWFTLFASPAEFSPDARCPQWEQFLTEALEGDVARIQLAQEWFGLSLVPDVRYQRFLLLVGPAGSGKSVFLDVLGAVVGEANVSAVPLECFGERFALWAAIGKLLNIAAETSEVRRADEATVKSFVGGDLIQVDRKNLPPVTVRPTARLVVASNRLPEWLDKSGGIWRRQLLLPFNREVPEGDQTLGFAKQLIREELSGILGWAVVGLLRLRERGRFEVPAASREATARHRLQTDTARRFLSEEVHSAADKWISSGQLFGAYRGWCDGIGRKPVNDANFAKAVEDVFPAAQKERRREGGRRLHGYLHIALGPPDEGGDEEGLW